MGSESMLQEILWDTKIGWWKVDMARRVLLLSDYLCKTIGTEESEIGYDRFLQSVGEPFRASLKSLMSTDANHRIFICLRSLVYRLSVDVIGVRVVRRKT